MLAPDDRALAARDLAIPALALCLDPAALADRVAAAAHPWGPVSGVTVDYLRYKPATSIVAGLVVQTGSGPRRVFAKAGARSSVQKLAKTTSYAEAAPDGFEPVLDEDLSLLIGPATADRELPGVFRLLTDPGALFTQPGTGDRVEVLRYKPERRLVARLAGPSGPVAVAKVQHSALLRDVLAASRAMSRAGLPVPRVLARSRRYGAVLNEHLEGTVPVGAVGDDELLSTVGELLARWHRVPAWAGLPSSSPVEAAAGLVDVIAVLVPRLRPVARAAVDAALAALPVGGAPVVVHGDFSVDQLLRRDGEVSVLDLDRTRADRPGVDVASWFAAEVAEGRCDPGADPTQVLDPMLRAYQRCSGRDLRPELAAHSSLALLARATEPFRLRQRPDWVAGTEELVTAAAGLAAVVA